MDVLLPWLPLRLAVTLTLCVARPLLLAHQFVHERLDSARAQQVELPPLLPPYAPVLLVTPMAALATVAPLARLRVTVATPVLPESSPPDAHVVPTPFHVLLPVVGPH